MRKVKIAQIGTSGASHGQMIFESLKRQADLFEIVGYTLPENEREKFPGAVKAFDGYPELSLEEILNDPEIEAVAVETEEIYLTKYALMAANSNKHIHMEKPGGMNLADFEKLVATQKSNGKIFHTGYMYRYNPFVSDLIDRAKNGELGEIISVEAQMSCYYDKDSRNWLEVFDRGGMMFFLGCHLIDLILQLQGTPERIVPFNKSSNIDGSKSKDFCMAVFEYKNGVSVAKTTSTEHGGYHRRRLLVNGTKGTIDICPLEVDTKEKMYAAKTECMSTVWGNKGDYFESEEFYRLDGMMAAFGAMVLGEKQNPYTYDYELELYKTILKAGGLL